MSGVGTAIRLLMPVRREEIETLCGEEEGNACII